jgi:hypothetical protein
MHAASTAQPSRHLCAEDDAVKPTPADLANPSDYGEEDETGSPVTGNFWDAEYQPSENIDDIPLDPSE